MRKREYDAKVKTKQFEIGQWVWYYYPRRYSNRSPKWNKTYCGPFLVVGKISPCDYVIQKTKKSSPQVVHGNKLKQCGSQTPTLWITPKHDQLKATKVQSTDETSVLTGSKGQPEETTKSGRYLPQQQKMQKRRDYPSLDEVDLQPPRRSLPPKVRNPPRHLMDYQIPSSHLQY